MAANPDSEIRIAVNATACTCVTDSIGIASTQKLHPLFTSSIADVILSSCDGYTYRIHSYTLRTTSGFFRDMFSLPMPMPLPSSLLESNSRAPHFRRCDIHSLSTGDGENEETGTCIPTHEPAEVLTLFLMLLTGVPIHTPLHKWGTAEPSVAADATNTASSASSSSSSSTVGTDPTDSGSSDITINLIERVLYLAENWDTPGPISYIRLGLRSPELLRRHPLRLYALACHFDWKYERHLAALHSLHIDLLGNGNRSGGGGGPLDLTIEATLERLSSKDVLSLMTLRRRRRDRFRELLDDPGRFAAGNSDNYVCARCGVTRLENKTWRALKEAMVVEMDRNALGDSIVGRPVGGIGGVGHQGGGILGWPEADACFGAICTKEGCGGLNYDRYVTLKRIQICVDSLPWALDSEGTDKRDE